MQLLALLAQDDSGSGGGGIVQLFILLLIPFAMYFLLIRPQRRRMREQASLQSSISQGDEVITNSGIYGFISAVEDDYFWLEIDDDVQIRIAKGAIQGVVDTSAAAESDADAVGADDGDGDES